MRTTISTSVSSLLLILALFAPAAALTPNEMQEAVRYYLEEESAYNFTSAEVLFYLNRAQEALPSLVVDDAFIDLTEIGTLPVQLNVYNQPAPSNYLRIKHVFLNDIHCTQWHIDKVWSLYPNNSSGAKPKAIDPYYVVFDDNIRLYPLQTTAGTYEVWYYRKPADMLVSNTPECELSPELEHLVVMLAAVYALKKDHEFQKATELMNQIQLEATAINTKLTGVHGLERKAEK